MRGLTIIAATLTLGLAAQMPPAPPPRATRLAVVRSPRDATSQVQVLSPAAIGAVATDRINVAIRLPRVRNMGFAYPAGLDPDRYVWTIESSTDLVQWTSYCACTNAWTTVFTSERARFFRVKGTPK